MISPIYFQVLPPCNNPSISHPELTDYIFNEFGILTYRTVSVHIIKHLYFVLYLILLLELLLTFPWSVGWLTISNPKPGTSLLRPFLNRDSSSSKWKCKSRNKFPTGPIIKDHNICLFSFPQYWVLTWGTGMDHRKTALLHSTPVAPLEVIFADDAKWW